jgi:hypothetical protein
MTMKKKDIPECEHTAKQKYLVARGKPGQSTGFLSCLKCLSDADLKLHPGSREFLKEGSTWTKNHEKWDDAAPIDRMKV